MTKYSTELLVDPFHSYMTRTPQIEYHDVLIEELSPEALKPFADSAGCFTKSFDATIKGHEAFSEIFIMSSPAY